MTTSRTFTRALAAAALSMSPAALAAQLPNASPAAHALGGNFTAIARGYEAIAWNPANLAMPGRPWFSLGIGVVGGSLGIDPVDFRALNEFSGRLVPDATKSEWVELARLAGGQNGRVEGGFTPLAFSVGPFGVQAGGATAMTMTLSPDAWEAMLFGNAGSNGGQPKELDLTGTRIRGSAIGSGGASFALPIPINLTNGALANEKAAIGITGKYVAGFGLLMADNVGSIVGTDDVVIQLPLIVNKDTSFSGEPIGTGFGADLALAWRGGPWRVGVLAENVFNSFKWDTTMLATVNGEGYFANDSSNFDFEDRLPFGAAPAALRALVTNQKFAPAITVGGRSSS